MRVSSKTGNHVHDKPPPYTSFPYSTTDSHQRDDSTIHNPPSQTRYKQRKPQSPTPTLARIRPHLRPYRQQGLKPMTKTQLAALPYRTILHHKTLKNADGTPLRCRVNGKLKTWITQPQEFQLPVKHGLRECFYITPLNAHQWELPGDNQ